GMKPGFGHGRKTFRSTADSMNVRPVDLLCRTAACMTRMYGGVGGGAVRLLLIPNRLQRKRKPEPKYEI
ncbi:MAG: hypothetical protein ABSF48_11670, partial [Thermodesulfobacteriota bacterium]